MAVGAVQKAQQDMLHRDILVLHGLGCGLSGLEGPVHILGHIDLVRLPAPARHLGQFLHLCLDRGGKAGHRHTHSGQQLWNKALLVGEKGQQQVLLLDLLIAVLHGQLLRPLDGCQGPLGKLIHIHVRSLLLRFQMLRNFSTLYY